MTGRSHSSNTWPMAISIVALLFSVGTFAWVALTLRPELAGGDTTVTGESLQPTETGLPTDGTGSEGTTTVEAPSPSPAQTASAEISEDFKVLASTGSEPDVEVADSPEGGKVVCLKGGPWSKIDDVTIKSVDEVSGKVSGAGDYGACSEGVEVIVEGPTRFKIEIAY